MKKREGSRFLPEGGEALLTERRSFSFRAAAREIIL